MQKVKNICFGGNLITVTSCKLYYENVSVTSFMNIKFGDLAIKVVP